MKKQVISCKPKVLFTERKKILVYFFGEMNWPKGYTAYIFVVMR